MTLRKLTPHMDKLRLLIEEKMHSTKKQWFMLKYFPSPSNKKKSWLEQLRNESPSLEEIEDELDFLIEMHNKSFYINN